MLVDYYFAYIWHLLTVKLFQKITQNYFGQNIGSFWTCYLFSLFNLWELSQVYKSLVQFYWCRCACFFRPSETVVTVQSNIWIKLRDLQSHTPVPVTCLVDWHMRNPDKNYGLLNSEGLFCLIKSGWLVFASLGLDLHLRTNRASLAQYKDCLFEQRYSFSSCPRTSWSRAPRKRSRFSQR
jgi:hypothetical protein